MMKTNFCVSCEIKRVSCLRNSFVILLWKQPVFSLQVTSSKIDIGPYKIVALSSEGEGGLLCLQSADFAHGGNQTSSLQFRVLNMPVLKFNASQCYPNADKEDSGKIQNSRCMQGTGLSLTITACSAAQQGHQHHHRRVCPSSPCNIRNLFLSLPPRSLTMFLSGED